MVADQDSVRLLAVEGCAALGKLLEPADCVANVLPVIVSFSQVSRLLFNRKFFLGRSSYIFLILPLQFWIWAITVLDTCSGTHWNER